MLTRAMAKTLSAASAHECLFVDFLSEEEPKKVSEALKRPGWVDAILDIQFSTCLCARYQANPKESHLIAVKRIFEYLKAACQLLGGKLMYWSAKKQQFFAMSSTEAEYVFAAGCCANIL
nr:hypothetical protein [Tanacetum cinerariifolium]